MTQGWNQDCWENINILRYADDTTLMAEREEELRSLLMKMKVESEKAGLKLNNQKTKIMASGPITSWRIDGETVETVRGFIFLDSKITVDADWSHKIKKHFLLGRKVMTSLDSTFKSRDIILGGSKITAYGDCSHEIKRHLLLGRKAVTNLDSILKSSALLCQQRPI